MGLLTHKKRQKKGVCRKHTPQAVKERILK